MRQTLRISAVSAAILLFALSSFAQSRPLTGTVIDVDEGRGRIQIEYDDDGSRTTIETDSVSTVYAGFGTVIAGKPEIFTGSSGLSNVRLGDRIEVRGAERGQGIVKADRITLVGRNVVADPVGVGSTREPTSVATPVDDRSSSTIDVNATSGSNVEGTIRQINEDEGRLVIQTTQRRMLTVRTYRSTPVLYRGETYRVSNLEVGDKVRVEADTRYSQNDEITAKRITVTQSVQDTGTTSPSGRVTTLTGTITRTEPGLDYAYIDDGRGETRVDMTRAEDASGETIRARDLHSGDQVEITGNFNRVGDIFSASTVRFTDPARDFPNGGDDTNGAFDRPALVTTGGTITETLDDASTLGLRETDTNRIVRIWAAPDLVVRLKAATASYTTAANLKEKDQVIVQAYRDARGNLIAQTIRVRNR